VGLPRRNDALRVLADPFCFSFICYVSLYLSLSISVSVLQAHAHPIPRAFDLSFEPPLMRRLAVQDLHACSCKESSVVVLSVASPDVYGTHETPAAPQLGSM
jgi:hypothetical protein